MTDGKRGADTVTLKIPRPLYENLQVIIQGTGFRSVTEFAIYVLRDLASTGRTSVAAARSGSSHPSAPHPPLEAATDPAGELEPAPTPGDAAALPPDDRLTPEEVDLIRRRLRALGYL